MRKTKCIKTWIYFVDYSYIINVAGGEGAEIVYSLKNNSTLAEMALNNIGDAGQIKRKVYQRRLPENPNKDYFYILRETGNVEPILVEYGFIDSTRDSQKLKTNLNNYVEGVVKAIADYTGYTYRPPGTSGPIEGEQTYTVKRGDTLYKIANMYNISVNELKDINNLTNDTLQIGQVLRLTRTSTTPSTITYTVKKDDTLYAIANAFNTTVNELKQLNNITGNTLYIGQEIQVPNNNNLDDEEDEDNDSDETEYEIYEVQKGDSLWLIANKYGITVDELININNLDKLTLQIGDKLKIPKQNNSSSSNKYIVQSGDTLWSIARANNISVDELKQLNNLNGNMLSIGQELIIRK